MASVAICFLFAYLVPEHEMQVKAQVQQIFPQAYISVPHEVLPEFREYERLSTTVVNAYLGPVVSRYIAQLDRRLAQLGMAATPYITQSNGGIISLQAAQQQPVRTVLSGPSSGVIGAAYLGSQRGCPDIITFDMGGTSTDVALVEGGRPRLRTERDVEGYPVKTPMVDVHTVGAGGGSVAWIDRGGLLKVGPQSAGAMPGPVCYGQGGKTVTVTDANVVLGSLNPVSLLGGEMPIDAKAARAALLPLAETLHMDMLEVARGIIAVVVANMIRAIQLISVQKGYDPRDFALMAFGGAGPLHAAWIARELGIRRILIPERPGLSCAFGLLVTDMRSDYTRTRLLAVTDLDLHEVNAILHELEARAQEWLTAEGVAADQQHLRRAVDMRYRGQNYELTTPLPTGNIGRREIETLINAFYQSHERTYGYHSSNEAVELVTFRVEAIGTVPKAALASDAGRASDLAAAQVGERQVYLGNNAGGVVTCPVYQRQLLHPAQCISGPAIIEQMDSTTLLLPQHQATIDTYNTIIISATGEPRTG